MPGPPARFSVAALAVALGLVASAGARADVVEAALECPPGEVPTSRPGCPGHGGGGETCSPARCVTDATCGPGGRCEDVARCFETREIECVGGDGRRPIEERPVSVWTVREERGPCGAGDACPAAAVCEHFRECRRAAAPASAAAGAGGTPGGAASAAVAETSGATPPPSATSSCACAAGAGRAMPAIGWLALALGLAVFSRRR